MKKADEIEQLVRQLADTQMPLAIAPLYRLSDLSGESLARFCETWPRVPVERRRQILGFLLEIAEGNLEVDFEAVYGVCMDDADEEVRAHAIAGLWESEDPDLIAPLLDIVQHDPGPQVRAAAAGSLGRFVLLGELDRVSPSQQRAVEDALLALVRAPAEHPEVRRRAVEALAFSSRDEVTAVIENAYNDPERLMRVAAVFAMGRNLDPRWEPLLLEELHSYDPEFRYEAARACGELELTSAVPRLAELLKDEGHEVQEAAIWAMGQIGGQQARQILEAHYETVGDDALLLEALNEALSEIALSFGVVQFPLYEYDLGADGSVGRWSADWLDGVLDDLADEIDLDDLDALNDLDDE